VREALFSMLQNDIGGVRFLDMFAGSGSVGLEALSRGAETATFVEQSPRSLASLSRNIAMLKVEARCHVIRANVYDWLAASSAHKAINGLKVLNALEAFDIAYADPPYELGEERGYAVMLARLAECGLVRQDGLFVAEMRHGQTLPVSSEWTLCRDRTYGQTRLAVYRRCQ
jgi:16S rRNA (guanine966-N2)-methyltransferase